VKPGSLIGGAVDEGCSVGSGGVSDGGSEVGVGSAVGVGGLLGENGVSSGEIVGAFAVSVGA